MNFNLIVVYYHKGKSNLIKINVDVTLSNLKDQLNQMNGCLNYGDTRMVASFEYHCQSIGSNGCVRFTNMKLLNIDDERTMFAIFDNYSSKGLIELDTMLVRSIYAIHKSLMH